MRASCTDYYELITDNFITSGISTYCVIFVHPQLYISGFAEGPGCCLRELALRGIDHYRNEDAYPHGTPIVSSFPWFSWLWLTFTPAMKGFDLIAVHRFAEPPSRREPPDLQQSHLSRSSFIFSLRSGLPFSANWEPITIHFLLKVVEIILFPLPCTTYKKAAPSILMCGHIHCELWTANWSLFPAVNRIDLISPSVSEK